MEDQRRFKLLETRLDALDYKFPFGQESIPLIEALLSDLSSLNISLQRCRQQKPDNESSKSLLAELRKAKEELEDSKFEIRRIKQELEECKGNLIYKEEDVRQYKMYLEKSNKDVETMKRNLQDERNKAEGFNMSLRSFAYIEEQLKTSRNQFEESLARERELHREIEKMRMQLQKSEEKMSYTLKQTENIDCQKNSIEQVNTKLQKNLSECLQRDSSKTLEISKLEMKCQELSLETDEQRRQIRILSDENYSLKQEVRSSQQMLESEKNYVDRQNDQIVQLKSFITSMECSRNEMVKKIESLQDMDNDKANVIKTIKEESISIKKQLTMSEKICMEGVSEKELLMKQIESTRYELGRRSDELATLKNSIKNYMNEIEDYKNKLRLFKESEETMKRAWRDSDIENSRLSELNQALLTQNEESKKTIFKLQNQIQDLTMEFRNSENHLKGSEDRCRTLEYDKKNLNSRLEESLKEVKNNIDIVSRLTKENEEITHKYELLLEDFEKVSRSYEYLNLDYKKTVNKLTSTENMNEGLKKQEELYLRSIKELEEELHTAIRDSEVSEYKRQEVEKTSESLKKDFYTVKSLTRDLDMNREDLQRKVTTLDSEKAFIESRLRSAENENLNLKSQIDYEKQRFEDLESRTIHLRTAENEILSLKSQLDFQKQRYEDLESRSMRDKDVFRRAELEDERAKSFNQPNSDIVSELTKQIEAYKSENLKLEMDNAKLFEDYSRKNQALRQAEVRITELEMFRR